MSGAFIDAYGMGAGFVLHVLLVSCVPLDNVHAQLEARCS